jgi:hypothetical protein
MHFYSLWSILVSAILVSAISVSVRSLRDILSLSLRQLIARGATPLWHEKNDSWIFKDRLPPIAQAKGKA